VDDSLVDGDEITIPVTDLTHEDAGDPYWKVTAESLSLGDFHHIFKTPTIAVLETTYFWISLPYTLANKLNELLGVDEEWFPFSFVDCKKRPNFPDLTFVLAGQEFIMTPYDYIVEQNEGGRISCLSSFFPVREDEDPVIFLGSAFLKTWVTVWDWEQRTVGCECLPPQVDYAIWFTDKF
jgi:saccharopepsin